MIRNVHIVALAARTAVGLTAETTAAAIRAGVSRVGDHPFMVDAAGEPLGCGYDRAIDPAAFGARRLVELTRAALDELAATLATGGQLERELPLFLALPEQRPGFSAQDAALVVRTLGAHSAGGKLKLAVHNVGRGHAGALQGIERACEVIAQGKDELCIVGGVDSYLDADALDWLDADKRLARPAVRGGFPPGEAAALLGVASEGMRRQLRLPSLALVRNVACAREARDETSPEGLLGEALSDVYARVTAELRQTVDDLYCDINDERARTTDFGFAMLRTATRFRDGTRYATSVGQIGDVGAASVPLNCILATRAWARGYASGPLALISGSSWTGLRGAALLQQSER